MTDTKPLSSDQILPTGMPKFVSDETKPVVATKVKSTKGNTVAVEPSTETVETEVEAVFAQRIKQALRRELGLDKHQPPISMTNTKTLSSDQILPPGMPKFVSVETKPVPVATKVKSTKANAVAVEPSTETEQVTVETEVDSTEESAVPEPSTEVRITGTKAPTVETSAVAVPAGSAIDVPMREQPKQGGKCCGCCCDFRKAVIVLSMIGIAVAILEVSFPRMPIAVTDDDVSVQIVDIHTWANRSIMIVGIFGLVMSILNLLGALLFIWQLNAIYLVYSLLQFALKIYFTMTRQMKTFDVLEELFDDDDTTEGVFAAVEKVARFSALVTYVISAIILVLWDYPTLFLLLEARNGIMKKETYPREEYSCCCTPR